MMASNAGTHLSNVFNVVNDAMGEAGRRSNDQDGVAGDGPLDSLACKPII